MDGKKLLLALVLSGYAGMTVWFASAGAIAADKPQLGSDQRNALIR